MIALANFLEQIGSQFQQVQETLSALGFEDLVQKSGKLSQYPAEFLPRKGRSASSSGETVILRELNEVASTFNNNSRDQFVASVRERRSPELYTSKVFVYW